MSAPARSCADLPADGFPGQRFVAGSPVESAPLRSSIRLLAVCRPDVTWWCSALWMQPNHVYVVGESGKVVNVAGDDGVNAVYEHRRDDVGIVDLFARALDVVE